MTEPKAEYVTRLVSQMTYKPIDCVRCGAILAQESELDGVPYLRMVMANGGPVLCIECIGHVALNCAECLGVTVWNGGSPSECPEIEPGDAETGAAQEKVS